MRMNFRSLWMLLLLPCCSPTVAGTNGSQASAAAGTSGTGSTATSSAGTTSAGTTGTDASSSTSSGTTGTSATAGTSGSSTGSSGSTGVAPLRFAFTGDTRPNSCDDFANYPSPVMQLIVQDLKTKNVGFALDTGDHMKVCKNTDLQTAQASAQQQMQLYHQATQALGAPFYYTMGNHECLNNSALCDPSDSSLSVFMTYLIVPTQTPYYTFDVQTPSGRATFVFVADTAWDATQAAWLDTVLGHGDGSTYTIISKHVPSDNTSDFSTNADEMQVIESHRFSLLLDSHSHEYVSGQERGREFTLGLGGAPVKHSGDDFAYGLVEQQTDGRLKVTIYNATSDTPRDSQVVGPN
jgi:hypothetical protein